jgi:hypothetical protein
VKTLYVIAWVGLTSSVIVHVLSILGPADVLSDVDAFVWILHGGVILLGFPMVLCSQKLAFGAQKKDFWKAALKNCPVWMKNMIGFFFLYGVINFILFISKSETIISSHGTPASVFKGFSGHWMIIYSMEVAVFYACLKKKP